MGVRILRYERMQARDSLLHNKFDRQLLNRKRV
jgi:hypothetical protein